jgi:hypothetical protein
MNDSLNRAQLVALVQRLLQADYHDDEECDQILATLQEHVSDPQISDYIFWPDRDMTAEDIIDRALGHQPIILHWSPNR